MTRKIVVNGREITVTLGPDGSFQAGSRAGEASIVEVEPGVYSVLLDGRSFEVHVQPGTLQVEGQLFAVEIEDANSLKRKALHAEGRQAVSAAMPGKVVRVLVQEGEEVQAGQGIVVIEAMKMQNELKSPKQGRVVALPVREGAAVSAGETLAVVE